MGVGRAGQARRAGLLLSDEATGKDEEEEDTGRTPPQVAHATRLLELGLIDQPPVCVPVVAVWGGGGDHWPLRHLVWAGRRQRTEGPVLSPSCIYWA